MLAGIRLGGFQSSVAYAQPAFVIFPDLARVGAIPAGGMLFHGDRDQPGTFHLGEANRLRQCPASRGGVVIGDQDPG